MMAQRKIGFVPNPPSTKTREIVFGDVTVVYTKERKPHGIIHCICECRIGNTWTSTSVDLRTKELSWEQVEEIPQFKKFVSSNLPAEK
jgi:hypothetical protein